MYSVANCGGFIEARTLRDMALDYITGIPSQIAAASLKHGPAGISDRPVGGIPSQIAAASLKPPEVRLRIAVEPSYSVANCGGFIEADSVADGKRLQY